MTRLLFCLAYLFIGAVLLAIPNITPRGLLFAVPLPPDFRETQTGRHAIWVFRTIIAAVVLAGECVLLLLPAPLLGAAAPAVLGATVLAGAIGFYQQNRRLAPAAVQYNAPREAELTSEPERLPRFTWLAAGPFAVLAAAAGWLYLNWSRIPGRFPVHFEFSGRPDRWAERTVTGVYGPLLFGAEICAWLAILAFAVWYGARRSRLRRAVMGVLITLECLLGIVFALIAVRAQLGIPVWVVALFPFAALVPLLIVITTRLSAASESIDYTPNECWKWSAFYYNPDDAAIFVQKRDGLGYTFNFANRWSWALLLSLGAVIASAPFVMA